MITPGLLAQLACAAVFVVAVTACTTTNKSADDKAMERAYELKTSITGSRIRRRVDPETGEVQVGFATRTLKGASAREMVRSMRVPMDPTN